jgi:hypothetical protein
MILEEHRDNPDQINQEEVQAHRAHQVDQADLHLRIDHLHRVHQVDQADLVVQADLVIQVVIEQEVRDQVEAEVHGLEKMNNATIAVLN